MLNIFNKYENTKESPLWKWAYIGLVILISVAYFIFSYYYIEEARYIDFADNKIEVKKGYQIYLRCWFIGGYIFLLLPLISYFSNNKIMYSKKTVIVIFLFSLSLLPHLFYFILLS
jgi:hypothetical protein